MKISATFFCLGLSFGVFAQGTQPTSAATSTLDVTNINARVLTGGDHFWDLSLTAQTPGFEVPRGSGKSTIFAGALWIGGKDQQNNLYVASQTYRQGFPFQAGYWPGPIATTQGPIQNTKYDKVWKVSRAEIQNHIANYNHPGYSMPTDIATWPGNGDVTNGEAIQLAPYVDMNNDGNYNPSQGDYPDILGDQALYYIINDKGNTKVPASPAMNAEIHVMFYGYSYSPNTALYNTVFTQYRIVNRGTTNFNNFYAGIWSDFELGRGNDDFGACDTTTNRYYAYNRDNFDGDTINGTIYTVYGLNPPVQSVIFLDKKMTHFLQYYNNTSPINGNPDLNSAQNYYNYLSGKWKNNTHLTYGGDGSNQSNPVTNYMFPGNPVTLNGWSEKTTPPNPGQALVLDRRGIGSIGPYNLNAGQELKFTVAYNFSQGTSNLNSVTQSQQDAIAIQTFFQNAILSTTKPEKLKQPLLLFPNPATEQLTIQLPDRFENKTATIQITDYTDRKVMEIKTSENNGKNLQLNISTLSKGIYQVSVISGTQRTSTKLVKM